MKKEGIQTRNRKLSSKSKKKKGMPGSCLPIGSHLGDLMKPLDPSKSFPGGFSASMGKCSLSLYLTLCHPKKLTNWWSSPLFTGQHGHLSSGLHPAHTHMHGGWYATGMGLGASSSLQSGFGGSLGGGGVVPHSQSYHLGLNSMVSLNSKHSNPLWWIYPPSEEPFPHFLLSFLSFAGSLEIRIHVME